MRTIEQQIEQSFIDRISSSGFGLARVKTEGQPVVYDTLGTLRQMREAYQIVGESEVNEYADD